MAAGERELFSFRDVVPGEFPMSVQAVLMKLVKGGAEEEEEEEEETKDCRSWCWGCPKETEFKWL